jgi:hypothetical protein
MAMYVAKATLRCAVRWYCETHGMCDGGEERYSKISFALAVRSNFTFPTNEIGLAPELAVVFDLVHLGVSHVWGLGLSLGSDCMLKRQ